MASDMLAARAEEIVDTWTQGLKDESKVGQSGFILTRSDLVHLVLGTLEIVLRRISGGLANKGIQIGDHGTQTNHFGGS